MSNTLRRNNKRLLKSAASLSLFATLAVTACSGDDKGTDILVPGGGSGGSSNAGSGNKAGSSAKAGSSSGGGDTNQAGGENGGEASGGENGTGGTSTGTAGMGGGAGSAGTGGGGNGGMSGGGNGGMAGKGGMGGGGMGGGGTGGTGGSAGNAGTSGAGGTGGTGGAGGTAGSGGTGGNANQCGNGKKDDGEECDNSVEGTPWKGDRECATNCKTVASAECVACEQAGDCGASSDNCQGPSATPFDLPKIDSCYRVLECMRDSHCIDGTGSLGKCYCGSLSTGACGAAPYDLSKQGAPDGPCAEVMQKAAPGTTSNTTILGVLMTRSIPLGAAGQRMNCQKNADECNAPCNVSK